MSKRTSDHGKHNRTLLLGGLKDSVNALAADLGLFKPKKHGTNSFDDALRETSKRKDDIIDELTRHAVVLSPVIKQRTFPELENVPEGLVLGWTQLPFTRGRGFSLGIFPDCDHFTQVAFADTHGRVFVGTNPDMDVQDMQARFMSGKEKEVTLPDGERLGEGDEPRSRSGFSRTDRGLGSALHHGRGLGRGLGHGVDGVKATTGGMVGRDDTGRMTWLAPWLKAGSRYTSGRMCANLPPAMRHDLEYRDAITIAFFAICMLPQINGLLIGFGPGNIFRRPNREAPIGATYCSVHDTLAVRAHGMRVFGLEDHFADLMCEAGALDTTPGLEAVHGAKLSHLYTPTYSNGHFFTWDKSLASGQALKSLKIEGSLDRFAAVNAWSERNTSLGRNPTEDMATRVEAMRTDMKLIEGPAIMAFDPYDGEQECRVVLSLINIAARMAGQTRSEFSDPRDVLTQQNASDSGVTNATGAESTENAEGVVERIDKSDTNTQAARPSYSPARSDEWVYCQTLSSLLRRLRSPYRFDAEFRSRLDSDETVIGFTTAGTSMMPDSRYDTVRRTWHALNSVERASMSVACNLRVGLMMAALSFGTNESVRQVSLHIDSIGLEEAIVEQDPVVEAMMSEALNTFEHLRSGGLGHVGSKADPKDGDSHGDPARPITHKEVSGQTMSGDERGTAGGAGNGIGPSADTTGRAVAESADADGAASIGSQFEDLMKGTDIGEIAFGMPDDTGAGDDLGGIGGEGIGTDGADGVAGIDDDPISVLCRNPTVRNVVIVTFTRDALPKRLDTAGFDNPEETYRVLGAMMGVDGEGGLKPTSADFDLVDSRPSPTGSQEEPELADRQFSLATAHALSAQSNVGSAIQRVGLLQHSVSELHNIARNTSLGSVEKTQRAMQVIESICDPKLADLASQVASALIDDKDTPDFTFTLTDDLDKEHLRTRDMLLPGQADQAIEAAETAVTHSDQVYVAGHGVPRCFNFYTERVAYNRLFATLDERTVPVPDNLFYAHMELAGVLSQIRGAEAATPHLSRMVTHAPAYPPSHLKLAIQLARNEDWDSTHAACLNVLRVVSDRDNAAFVYYRFTYAEWMLDRFDTAAAVYIMSDHIAPGVIGPLESKLQELVPRADSQCILVPESVEATVHVLATHDLPVWPHIEVADIVCDAARVCVDGDMFVPACTLSVTVARTNDGEGDNIDTIQAQFLRPLSA